MTEYVWSMGPLGVLLVASFGAFSGMMLRQVLLSLFNSWAYSNIKPNSSDQFMGCARKLYGDQHGGRFCTAEDDGRNIELLRSHLEAAYQKGRDDA